jgi:hypothetical protein
MDERGEDEHVTLVGIPGPRGTAGRRGEDRGEQEQTTEGERPGPARAERSVVGSAV